MVLTKAELIASLQNEVRILLHLASKIDDSMFSYRPSAKQRSILELLQYLTYMGPELINGIKGGFDTTSWAGARQAAATRDFGATLAEIERQADIYPALLDDMSDADLRAEVDMFGRRGSRGFLLVNIVLAGCAAYRTQLFLYLKACGREELDTMNLWAGMDAPARA